MSKKGPPKSSATTDKNEPKAKKSPQEIKEMLANMALPKEHEHNAEFNFAIISIDFGNEVKDSVNTLLSIINELKSDKNEEIRKKAIEILNVEGFDDVENLVNLFEQPQDTLLEQSNTEPLPTKPLAKSRIPEWVKNPPKKEEKVVPIAQTQIVTDQELTEETSLHKPISAPEDVDTEPELMSPEELAAQLGISVAELTGQQQSEMEEPQKKEKGETNPTWMNQEGAKKLAEKRAEKAEALDLHNRLVRIRDTPDSKLSDKKKAQMDKMIQDLAKMSGKAAIKPGIATKGSRKRHIEQRQLPTEDVYQGAPLTTSPGKDSKEPIPTAEEVRSYKALKEKAGELTRTLYITFGEEHTEVQYNASIELNKIVKPKIAEMEKQYPTIEEIASKLIEQAEQTTIAEKLSEARAEHKPNEDDLFLAQLQNQLNETVLERERQEQLLRESELNATKEQEKGGQHPEITSTLTKEKLTDIIIKSDNTKKELLQGFSVDELHAIAQSRALSQYSSFLQEVADLKNDVLNGTDDIDAIVNVIEEEFIVDNAPQKIKIRPDEKVKLDGKKGIEKLLAIEKIVLENQGKQLIGELQTKQKEDESLAKTIEALKDDINFDEDSDNDENLDIDEQIAELDKLVPQTKSKNNKSKPNEDVPSLDSYSKDEFRELGKFLDKEYEHPENKSVKKRGQQAQVRETLKAEPTKPPVGVALKSPATKIPVWGTTASDKIKQKLEQKQQERMQKLKDNEKPVVDDLRKLMEDDKAITATVNESVAYISPLTIPELHKHLEASKEKLTDYGINSFKTEASQTHINLNVKINDTKETEVRAVTQPENKGISYNIKSNLSVEEKKLVIENICKLAVATAQPGTEFKIPNNANKEITTKALNEALKAKYPDYKEGDFKVPEVKAEVKANPLGIKESDNKSAQQPVNDSAQELTTNPLNMSRSLTYSFNPLVIGRQRDAEAKSKDADKTIDASTQKENKDFVGISKNRI